VGGWRLVVKKKASYGGGYRVVHSEKKGVLLVIPHRVI
jgi:hypothetical protein